MKTAALFPLGVLAFAHILQARVVKEDENGFAECNVFFKEETPPQGFAEPFHVKICQKYNGEERFATLYSTEHNIPVYSAFKYSEAAPSTDESWLIEPQLDDPENGVEEMMAEADARESVGELGRHQAVQEDYTSSNYLHGSLNPSYLNEGDFQRATFTLTNAVPVTQKFQDSWSMDVDRIVKEALVPQCENRDNLYLIVGAVPSDQKINNKVAVPELLWLAVCCNTPGAWSMGFLQKNMETNLESLTIEELKTHLPEGVQLFTNNCGEDSENAAQSKILETISQIRSEEAEKAMGPFFRFLRFLVYVVVGIVKSVLYTVWFIIKQMFNVVAGGLCCLWNGVTTYLMEISTVLANIPCDVFRVVGNILMGCLRTVDNVLTVVGMIARVPLRFVLDLGRFPYYTLCAIPKVGKEIAVGLFGSFSLLIDAMFGVTGGSFSLTSFACNRFVQRFSGLIEGQDE